MTLRMSIQVLAFAATSLAVAGLCAAAAEPKKIDFSTETVGGEPASFLNVVGIWRIENDRQQEGFDR